MYGWSFNPAFQVYAARGYGVLYLNPRGSSGYGQKFSDGTINEWGGGDYRDLMAGVDEVLRKNSWVDGDRLGVTGGSYGGFMTNWIITQTPRFRGAVAVASLSNLISFYSTSLYQDLIHAEFGGFPWDNFESAVAMVAAAVREASANANTLPPWRKRQRRSHHSGGRDVHGAEATRRGDSLRPLSTRRPRIAGAKASCGRA